MHYPGDVLAGAVIGISIGVFVLWLEKKGLFERVLKSKKVYKSAKKTQDTCALKAVNLY